MASAAQKADNIRVAVRIRPFIKREKYSQSTRHWKANGNNVVSLATNIKDEKCFHLDKVFDERSSTFDVYQEFAAPVVLSAMRGFNGTIFAYGQTSSGKTFTMLGNEKNPGVISLAMEEIFNYITMQPGREYLIRCSYLEIYNENITDLLKPGNKNLDVREKPKVGFFVDGIHEVNVVDPDGVFSLMDQGERNRHYGKTDMNERSSRSHTIFQMVIESREVQQSFDSDPEQDPDQAIMVAQLNLVDLAGSERASATGAEGTRLKEGCNINRSLFTLGSVISKLSEGSSHVNFRDSKLTRILKKSLGGNAKTSIICTITSADQIETQSTLEFATRAKSIQNEPVVNEVMDDGTQLKRCKKELAELKRQFAEVTKNTRTLELQNENEKAQQQKRITELMNMFCCAGSPAVKKRDKQKRRETWAPGAFPKRNVLTPTSRNENNLSSLVPLLEESQMEEALSYKKSLERLSYELDEEFRGRCSSPILTEFELEDNFMPDDDEAEVVKSKLEGEDACFRKLEMDCRMLECTELQQRSGTTELEDKSEECEKLRKEVEKLTEECELLKQKEKENHSLEAELGEKSKECQKLVETLHEEKDRNETLCVEIKTLSEAEVIGARFREELKVKAEQIETLQIQLQEANQLSEQFHQRCDTLEECSEMNSRLQEDLEQNSKECERLKANLEDEQTRNGDLCLQLDNLKAKRGNNGNLVKELLAEKTALEQELRETDSRNAELEKDLMESKNQTDLLRKECHQMKEEMAQAKNSLLRDTNRDMVQTRTIDKMKAERRETFSVQAHVRQDMEKERQDLEKKIADLETKCRHHQSERDLAEHNVAVAAKQVEDMKLEIREKEKLFEYHNKSLPVSGIPQDPGKLIKIIKQLEFSNELTKQKLEKVEKQSKEFEAELRKLQGADLRNSNIQEENKSLLVQLEQTQTQQQEKNKKLNEFSVEVNMLQVHVDKLTDEARKSKAQLEKKTTKIEELEETLLQAREHYEMIEELNKTVQTKHEQLEHMTFLVDEKDLEIEEVKTTLDEYKNYDDDMRQQNDKLSQLEKELEVVTNELERTLKEAREKDVTLEEYHNSVKQQQEEISRLMEEKVAKGSLEEVESRCYELEKSVTEKGNKIFELEAELGCLQHELGEVKSKCKDLESSLEMNRSTINNQNAKIEALVEDLHCANDDLLASLDNAEFGKKAEGILLAKSAEIEDLKKDLESMSPSKHDQEEFTALKLRFDSLAAEKRALEGKLEEAARELEVNDILKEKLAAAEETVAHEKAASEEMHASLEALIVEKCALEDILEAGAKTESEAIVALKDSLEAAEKMIERGKIVLEEKQTSLETLIDERHALEDKLENAAQIESETINLKTSLEAAEMAIADGKVVFTDLQSRFEAVVAEKLAIEQKLEKAGRTETEVISLKASLEAAEKVIANGEVALADSQSSIETLSGEKCAMEEQLKIRLNDEEHLRARFESLAAEKRVLESELENASIESDIIITLRENLDAAQKTIADGKLALEEKEKDGQSNTKALASLKELVESLSAEKTNLEKKLEDALEDNRSLLRLYEMSKKLDEEDETCSLEMAQDSQQSFIELKVQLDDASMKNTQLQENLSKLKAISDGLKKYSEELESKVERLTSHRQTLEEDVKNQNQLYLQYMLRSEELEGSIKSAVIHKEAAENTLKSVLDKANKEKLQLEKELEVLQSQVLTAEDLARTAENKNASNADLPENVTQASEGSSPKSSVNQAELEVKYQSAVEEVANLKKSRKEDQDYFLDRIDHLTQLVDEQDEVEEKNQEKIKTLEASRLAVEEQYKLAVTEIERLRNSIQEIELQVRSEAPQAQDDRVTKLEGKLEEQTFFRNHYEQKADEYNNIIHELGDEMSELVIKVHTLEGTVESLNNDETRRSTEEELAKAKADLADKELTIFSLEYQRSKDVEEFQQQLLSVKKESDYYLEKCGKLKQEIRKLRNLDETMVAKPSASDKDSAGVVSSVMIHSLRAKLYERERRLEDSNKKLEDLENLKTSLEYAKAEALTQATRLRSENNGLKMKLREARQKLREQRATTDEEASQTVGENDPPVLRDVQGVQTAQGRCQALRTQATTPWLTADSLDDMFKEKPNNCQTQ